jgi:lipopolysaccharide export system protein LptC
VKARANTLFTLGLAAGLAGLTFWLERLVQTPVVESARAESRVPESTADGVIANSMDETGRTDSKLTAKRMQHFPADQITEFEDPRLVQYRGSGPPVVITAERGTVNKNGEEVRLYGNVVVRREATADRPELRVDTTFLQVFPKTDIARTPEPVVITEGKARLSGVGMVYDNKQRRFELHARVSGTFIPERK